MFALQHTQRMSGIFAQGTEMGLTARSHTTSVSSMSDLSDAESTKQHHQHQHTGPYMEGNMKLLATMYVVLVPFFGFPFNSLPNDKIFDLSKSKAFADDGILFWMGEKHCGKRRK